MKARPHPGVLLVATRELRWMVRDRLALFLAVGVPLLAFALLSWNFSNAVIRGLNVSIVDADRSPTSMIYVQAAASAPGVTIAERSSDLTGAMHAIRSGEAIAAVYIPPDFERDFFARKRPQIVVFYNRQFFTPGNSASSALSGAIAAATAALPPTTPGIRASFAPGSLVVERYVLSNPAQNYVQFLLRAILPTILHVVTAIAGGYAIGSEFSMRGQKAWLAAAGGSALAALVGKLLPLFGIFILVMAVAVGIIHGLYHVPFRGDSVMMGAAACMMLLAYLSLGALLQLLTGNLALGLSLVGLFCSPAFGFAGVGFPILAMNAFARFWGDLMPLRWYIQILFDQAVRGLPVAVSAQPFAILGAIAFILFALSWLRLRAIARKVELAAPRKETATPREEMELPREEMELPIEASPRLGGAFVAELRRIFRDKSVLALLVIAPVIYGVLYPQPYLGQLLRDLPVAVVDQDHTELSRDFVQALNADEALAVTMRADSLAEAQDALARRQVFAIVEIPQGAERDILKGDRSRIAAYVDSAYFLLYSRVQEGISAASADVSQRIAAHGARIDGSLAHAALIKSSPVSLLNEPLFNPTGGYASYVVPAAFVLILQQTLFMGVAALGGVAFEQGGRTARRGRAGFRKITGQALAHLCLAAPGLALYLIVLPRVYGFSTLGRLTDLVLMAAPFILSVSFMAQFVGAWFKRRESAMLLFIASSLPLFFMVGVSWPVEAIPHVLRDASFIFPSTSAIDGLVRINQMGANLHDLWRDWLTLWILTGVYAVLAALATRLLNREEAPV